MKYIMDIDVDKATMSQLRGTYTPYDHEVMEKVLQYLKSFAPCKFNCAKRRYQQ